MWLFKTNKFTASLVLHVLCLFLILGSANAQKNNQNQTFINDVQAFKKQFAQYNALQPVSESATDLIANKLEILTKLLMAIFENPAIRYQKPDELIKTEGLSVVFSPDRKLYLISFDAKTGGSFKENFTLMHGYSPSNNIFNEWLTDIEIPLASMFYDQIDVLNANVGRYLLIGQARTCNWCISCHAMMLEIGEEELNWTEIAGFDGREGELKELKWNSQTLQFTIAYESTLVGDDLLQTEIQTETIDRIYKIAETFVYKDDEFVLKSSTMELIE